MNDKEEPHQATKEPSQPSCSYTPSTEPLPKGIMKSTPKMDLIVSKIWQQPNHEQITTTTIEDSSTEDYPVQPPIKKIEVVYLDSSESTNNKPRQPST